MIAGDIQGNRMEAKDDVAKRHRENIASGNPLQQPTCETSVEFEYTAMELSAAASQQGEAAPAPAQSAC